MELVEAPGTAPGSEKPIPQAVYRHSRVLRRHTEFGTFRRRCRGWSLDLARHPLPGHDDQVRAPDGAPGGEGKGAVRFHSYN